MSAAEVADADRTHRHSGDATVGVLTSPGARMMLIRAGSADEAWGQADGATDGMMYPPQPIDGHFNSGVPVAPFYEQVRACAALCYACVWLLM